MALPAFRVAGTISGGNPRVSEWTVAAAQTFVAGDLVVGSGTNDEIAALAANGAAVLGIAMAPAAGNIGKKIPVTELTPDVILSGALSGAWATTDVLENAGAGTQTVDQAAANSLFLMRGLDETDDKPAGTRRVLVSILAAASQAAGGDSQVA